MTTQRNKQKVYFLDEGKFWVNWIDLKEVYSRVHSAGTPYGSSADMLIYEMFSNILELIFSGRIDAREKIIITDYGCGKSRAANVVGKVLADNIETVIMMKNHGIEMKEAVGFFMPELKAANGAKAVFKPEQIERYGSVIVQRYDIGIEEYATPLKARADVVFCNDVFEHIPLDDMMAFLVDLESAGRYIFASISLRDAVNYSALPEKVVKEGALMCSKRVIPKDAIILEKNENGEYIFSLHVSVLPKKRWRAILGEDWALLPAQDYTACAAMNFKPRAEYVEYKRELIAEVGFADFIGFPTPIGTRYEKDPVLFARVAKMQPAKHIMKLEELKGYPDSAFKAEEKAKSEAFLKFVGLEVDGDGKYDLAKLPEGWLEKLYDLEKQSKKGLENLDAFVADMEAAKRADEIIAAG